MAYASSFVPELDVSVDLLPPVTPSFAFILEAAFEKLLFLRDVAVLASVLTVLDSLPFGGAEDEGFEEEFRLCLVALC